MKIKNKPEFHIEGLEELEKKGSLEEILIKLIDRVNLLSKLLDEHLCK